MFIHKLQFIPPDYNFLFFGYKQKLKYLQTMVHNLHILKSNYLYPCNLAAAVGPRGKL